MDMPMRPDLRSLRTAQGRSGILCCLLVLIVIAAAVIPVGHGAAETAGPLEIEAWLRQAVAILAATDSYTAIFHKEELIAGRLTDEETIYLKVKKPFKVYMKWIARPFQGRESLYVEGSNNNRIRVRECGLAGLAVFNLDPRSSVVMSGSRHPITDSGLENLARLILDNIRRGIDEGAIVVRDQGGEVVYGAQTRRVEIEFPLERRKDYYSCRAVVNFGVTSKMPVRIQIYDQQNRLVERYGYEDIRLDAGLTDADFDPGNAAYGF